MGRPPLPIGSHGNIRFYAHPHPDGPGWRATTKFRDEDGVTRPVSRTGQTQAAAKRKLQKALTERVSPTGVGIDRTTRLKVVAPLWLEDVDRRRAGTTSDTYRRRANRVIRDIGNLQLSECTVPAIDAYFRRLEDEEHLAANTVRSIRSVVSGILGHATRIGAIPANPVRDVGNIEGGSAAARALTGAERAELLAKVDADERAVADGLPDLFRFMLGTGARIGEVLALRWGQIDLDTGEALIGPVLTRVTGKGLVVNEGGKKRRAGQRTAGWRLVPLPDFVVLMLRMRYSADTAVTTPVFANTRAGWRDPNNTQRSVRKVRAAAGFPWLTTHVFRKTAVTIMDEQGLTPREIAGHVGHSRPSITMDVYMDLRSRGRSTADALDAALRGPTP